MKYKERLAKISKSNMLLRFLNHPSFLRPPPIKLWYNMVLKFNLYMLFTETNLLTRIKTRTKNSKFLVIVAKVCNLVYRPAPLNQKFQLLQFITIPFILPISIAQTLLIWDFLAKLGPSYNYPFLLILLIRITIFE